jgi:hypothetical protein
MEFIVGFIALAVAGFFSYLPLAIVRGLKLAWLNYQEDQAWRARQAEDENTASRGPPGTCKTRPKRVSKS